MPQLAWSRCRVERGASDTLLLKALVGCRLRCSAVRGYHKLFAEKWAGPRCLELHVPSLLIIF